MNIFQTVMDGTHLCFFKPNFDGVQKLLEGLCTKSLCFSIRACILTTSIENRSSTNESKKGGQSDTPPQSCWKPESLIASPSTKSDWKVHLLCQTAMHRTFVPGVLMIPVPQGNLLSIFQINLHTAQKHMTPFSAFSGMSLTRVWQEHMAKLSPYMTV